jgi:hypothetical protein
MIALDLRPTWRKARAAIEAHNHTCITGLRTDGEPTFDLRRKLRAEHRDLLHSILVLYTRQLEERPVAIPALSRVEVLPAFRTNSPALAKVVGCSARTVRNLLTRLIEAGLLAGKEQNGRKADYLLHVRPDLLVLREVEADRDGDTLRQTLPPLSHLKKKNNLKGGQVDSLGNAHLSRPDTLFAGNPRLQKPQAQGDDRPAGCAVTNRPGGADQPSHQETRLQEEGHRATVRGLPNAFDAARFEDYFQRLLCHVVPQLYQRLPFLAASQVQAMRDYFRGCFVAVPVSDWELTYLDLRIRIMLAGEWLKRDPRRYIPIPQRYFWHGNAKGFDGTARWRDRMAETSAKAERQKRGYQLTLRAFGAFMTVIGTTLAANNLQGYTEGRRKAEGQLTGLGRAFDHIILQELHHQT